MDGVDGEDDGEFGLCAACACAASPNESVSAHSIAQHAIQTRRGVRDTSVRSFNFRSTEPSPLPVAAFPGKVTAPAAPREASVALAATSLDMQPYGCI